MSTHEDDYTDYEKRVICALTKVREVSGVKQVDLSIAAGMGRNQVNRYENLKVHASLGSLDRLVQTIARIAPQRTNVTTLYDLLAFTEGKIGIVLTQQQPGE